MSSETSLHRNIHFWAKNRVKAKRLEVFLPTPGNPGPPLQKIEKRQEVPRTLKVETRRLTRIEV